MAATFVGFAGFTLVMPFLPLYVAELGVEDVGEIATWTGVSLGVTPAITALLAPLWGRLADRVGRKLLVARSLVSFIVIMGAMAFVTHPWQLLALRIVQGVFAGYGSLCLAMAADCAPRHQVAQAISLVQTTQRLGPAVGPVLGGIVAGLVGLRQAFLVTAAFYVVALIQLIVLYREPRVHRAPARERRQSPVTFRSVLAFENFVILMGVIFGVQFVDRSLGPVLPLHIAAKGITDVAFASGVVFSVLALSAAIGHHVTARRMRGRSARGLITRAALVAAVAVAGVGFAPGLWTMMGAAAAFGYAVGATMTVAYTTAAGVMPASVRGTGFGLLTSASLVGVAASPMVSGLLAGIDLRAVFLVDAVILCVLALSVRHVMAETPAAAATPAMEDA
ncbi:MAG TPA: MFS transporter [Vicinamibacterales bacterium]|nr:MFS transporter [Vicinamibacterales bacterium]